MATALLDSGEADVAVERHLVDAGVSFEMASRIITEHHRATAAAEKSGGRSDMQFGAIAFLGGGMVMGIGGTSRFGGGVGLVLGAVRGLYGLCKEGAVRSAG